MQRRNVIILAAVTILITLIIVASFAPRNDAPVLTSPLVLQSPIDVTLTMQHYAPIIMLDFCCTPTARPTLPGPTPTDTPRPTP